MNPIRATRPGYGRRPAVGGGWRARFPSAVPGATPARRNWPLARIIRSRRRTAMTPGLQPHTVQLCIHCRQVPAGFWVRRTCDQTVRCLSCCQQLDPGRYHVVPFDGHGGTGRFQ